MVDLSRDPIVNIIERGIKGDLSAVVKSGRWRAAVILTFSGIDTMAYLGCPEGQLEVTGEDFITWCERYVRFEGPHQLAGLDLWGARCGIVHTYAAESRTSRAGRCRIVLYSHDRRRDVPVRYRPEINPEVVIVRIEALAEAFFRGVDRFLVDVFSDKTRAAAAENRFAKMYHLVPADEVHKPAGMSSGR